VQPTVSGEPLPDFRMAREALELTIAAGRYVTGRTVRWTLQRCMSLRQRPRGKLAPPNARSRTENDDQKRGASLHFETVKTAILIPFTSI